MSANKLSDNEEEEEEDKEEGESSDDKEDEEEEDEEEDDLYKDEDEEEEEIEEDCCVPADIDEEMDMVFNKNESKKKSVKTSKKKLFPFIQKKKHKEVVNIRNPPEFVNLVVRETAKPLISRKFPSKSTDNIEKLIYNCTVRECKKEFLKGVNVNSLIFKTKYLNILYHIIGCPAENVTEVISELKQDLYGWTSFMYKQGIEIERKELEKLQNPEMVNEYPDNPCSKCGGIKHFMQRKQLRGGDEGQTIMFWCENSRCKHYWTLS